MATTVPVHAKGWMKSLTIMFNGLIALAVAGDAVVEAVSASELFPDVVTKWLILIFAIVNIMLRARTTQPLANTPVSPQVKPAEAPAPGTPHA